jgi:hypothetical protein
MTRTGSAAGALALGLLFGSAAVAAELEFYQTVAHAEVGVEDTFEFSVVAINAPEDAVLRLPKLDGFEVLSNTPVKQTSIQVTGAGTQVQRINKRVLVLRPTRTGALTIPPSQLEADGEVHRSSPIEVVVKPGRLLDRRADRRRGSDPFRNFPFGGLPGFDEPTELPGTRIPRSDSDLFVRTIVDRKQVYIGEQVTMSVYVFSRVDLSSVDTVTLPKLDGFWSEDTDSPTQLMPEQRTVEGVPYRAYLLKRKALFPTRAGTLDISPAEADITTGYLFAGHRVHRVGNAVEIEVKPLPAGAPTGFSATNVGRWQLTVEASADQVRLGEPVTLRLAVEGRGNIKNLELPKVSVPSGLRLYEPTTTDRVSANRGQLGGRRLLEYLLMPSQTGSFTLPGLALSFFDPETGRYEATRTEPITFTVLPGGPGPDAVAAGPTAGSLSAEEPKNVLAAGGLRPLRHQADFGRPGRPAWESPWFAPALAAPLAAWLALGLLGLVRQRLTKDPEGRRRRQQARAARERLKGAQRLAGAGETAEFYGEVERAVHQFIGSRFEVNPTGLTQRQLDERLAAAGIPDARRAQLGSLLERCEMGRYGGMGADARERRRALEDAAALMETLDRP